MIEEKNQNVVTTQRKCYRRQFKATLQRGARKGKVTERSKTFTFSTSYEEPPKK